MDYLRLKILGHFLAWGKRTTRQRALALGRIDAGATTDIGANLRVTAWQRREQGDGLWP